LRRREEKHASRNGFVSGMNCSPHFSIALRRLISSAAYRPAGTREALPGTNCETFVPHFLRRALDAAPDYQRKVFIRTEASA
jgi:hypothetical protein